MKTLHVYGQEAWHDDVHLIGDAEALKELRDKIDHALKTGTDASTLDFFCSDGEGFGICIALATEEEMDNVALPYTAEYAKDNREQVFCAELWFAQKKKGKSK